MSNMSSTAAPPTPRPPKSRRRHRPLPGLTASGYVNILDELGYAWQLNQTLFDNAFTAREMAEMVYLNTARCTGLYPRYGQIVSAPTPACVIGDPADPYMALINARPPRRPADHQRRHSPRYGDPAMMTALGAGGESASPSAASPSASISP